MRVSTAALVFMLCCSDRRQGCSFLKKRTKGLLILRRADDPGHGRQADAGAGTKVFCFFSSEKKDFSCLAV
jgi:hypothetical protein